MSRILTVGCLLLFIGSNAVASDPSQECLDRENQYNSQQVDSLKSDLSKGAISKEEYSNELATLNYQSKIIADYCKARPPVDQNQNIQDEGSPVQW
jgi:hypothetical protein